MKNLAKTGVVMAAFLTSALSVASASAAEPASAVRSGNAPRTESSETRTAPSRASASREKPEKRVAQAASASAGERSRSDLAKELDARIAQAAKSGDAGLAKVLAQLRSRLLAPVAAGRA